MSRNVGEEGGGRNETNDSRPAARSLRVPEQENRHGIEV